MESVPLVDYREFSQSGALHFFFGGLEVLCRREQWTASHVRLRFNVA